ncbi:MAG: hypothetical protein MH204_01515 [Fimbriimonadaceae bacterium]|nr:hypothetical protein [Fimbriimonadaceae bacterium]
MTLRRILPTLCLAVAASGVWAQTSDAGVATQPETGLVSVSSRGEDVRNVLFDLFSQGNRSFVLQPNVRFVLYLNLKDLDFEEALAVILRTAQLKSERRNGIWYITKDEGAKPFLPTATATPEPKPQPAAPVASGRLDASVLQKRITTRLAVTDIREVFAEFGRQTGIKLEVADSVPNVRIDAFLLDTSLKYSLDVIADAVGLRYAFTDRMSIRIEKKGP